VMRRAIRHGHRLGIRQPFLHEMALEVVRTMGQDYPELERRKELVASVARAEEERFRETIDRGLKILEDEIDSLRASGSTVVRGETAFKLYDTYGFPADLTDVIAQERGLTIDLPAYERALEEQRARSEGSKLNDEAAVSHVWRDVLAAVRQKSPDGVKFVGYEREEAQGHVLAVIVDASRVDRASEGTEAMVVTDVTPFYGESGGQAGDRGVIEATTGDGAFAVRDTQKPLAGLFVHQGRVEKGSVAVGDTVRLAVDHGARTATRRNHSATHLLHWALRTVLGEQATQKGSLVASDRLRFDFSHGRALTHDELARIEDLVNAKVLSDAPVLTEVLPIDEARRRGAVAIFEEKYGDVVRMLTMTRDSVELCGGTHARSLGEIGMFKIVSEQGLAAGVRRIEAATGLNALAYVRSVEGTLRDAARAVKAPVGEVPEKIEKLLERERTLEKEMAELNRKVAMGGAGSAGGGVDDMLRGARDIPGGRAVAVKVSVADPATMRELAERLRDKLGEAVVLVGAAGKDKATLVLVVSRGLTNRYKAGDLVKGIAQMVGGSGGGRPDMAQAGGTQVDRLDEALESLYARLA
jgi:alanyl-tRNA synthetase